MVQEPYYFQEPLSVSGRNPIQVGTMQTRTTLILILSVCLLISPFCSLGVCDIQSQPKPSSVTILCYMNGDNDLAQEVLHALDMMETIGSSDRVNVIALVDGHPKYLGGYDAAWSRTRLLRLKADPRIGRITSPVLEEWGEANLGAPQTLERFVRSALTRYPAQRYLFYIFAHSQGVINTRTYSLPQPVKTVSFSRDDSSDENMSLNQFHQALKSGLAGQRFDLMVLFSCLANMAEIGYTLSDVTRYLVSSQDEIRMVNLPPGQYQIRGLRVEQMIAAFKESTPVDLRALGRVLVDSHVNDYAEDEKLLAVNDDGRICRFVGGMALVDAAAMPTLASELDTLAQELIRCGEDPEVIQAIRVALSTTQKFASFLNLEYYDLLSFIRYLRAAVSQAQLKIACDRVLNIIVEQVLVYASQTSDSPATGISIYFSHPLVPDNIFQVHQSLYRANPFSEDTHWDEMIAFLRPRLKRQPDDNHRNRGACKPLAGAP